MADRLAEPERDRRLHCRARLGTISRAEEPGDGRRHQAAEIMEHFPWCSGEESLSSTRKRTEVANEIGDANYLLELALATSTLSLRRASSRSTGKSIRSKARGRVTKYVISLTVSRPTPRREKKQKQHGL